MVSKPCVLDKCPNLAAEWDCQKNRVLGLTPGTTPASSNKRVWWLCSKGHSWRASVVNRSRGTGCPYCSGSITTTEASIYTTHPALAEEWDYYRNVAGPEAISFGSHMKAFWKCSSGHLWRAVVSNRAAGAGCPQSISRISQAWLDSLGIPEEFREYPIKLPGRKRAIKVDGFDPKTNTVYEFLGDFWHGNPDLYDSKDVNPVNRKTYGALYTQTIRRLAILRKAGHIVVFIWENDFSNKT